MKNLFFLLLSASLASVCRPALAQHVPPYTAADMPAAALSTGAPSAMAAVPPPAAKFTPSAGDLNLDVNYPGLGLRYFHADGKALELIGQRQDDIFTGALRYYYYPAKLAGPLFTPYLAVEGDYINFKGSYSKGTGWGGGVFAGTEYYLGRKVSVQADLGALYVSVKDKDTSLIENGLEFLVTVGVNFYFTRGGQ